ncbi:MAG: ATP-binding protein [Thermodesulfobacteriota bacterium]|nr:ATP-binding protein [Thermodesulfobacteriota bacterium]
MAERVIEERLEGLVKDQGSCEQSSEETAQINLNRSREFSILERIIDSMKFLPDLAKVYLTIVDVVIDETKAENCSLMLFNKDTNKLVVRAAKGKEDRKSKYYEKKKYRGKGFDVGEGIAGRVVREGKPFLIADTEEEKSFVEFEGSSFKIKSLLCTPVFINDEVIGVFNLSSSRPGVFELSDLLVLNTISNLAASTLSTSLLYEDLQKLNKTLEEKVEEKTAVLKASEQKYRALVQEADDGIFIFQDGEVQFANRRFEEILGYSAEKHSLRSPNNILFVERMEEYLREMKERLDNKKSPSHFEFSFVRDDTEKVEIEMNVTIIEYAGSSAVQGIARDITARRKIERLKSSFLAMAAHELRNPITVISGYNNMLLKGKAGPINPQQHQILEDSKESCDRLANFAREVMELSRIDAGRMRIDFQEGDIGECVKSALKVASTLAKKKKITLEEAIPRKDLPKIAFDSNRIEQVFVNLIVNAINHTPQGGKVEIAVIPPINNLLKVCVMDNGIGVPPAERETIFDEFRVGKRSENAGIGLGLAICKKIIEAHGGRIWVESRKGGGSKFVFTLPSNGPQP